MLSDLMQKNDKLVIGLMSGTSADGVDAVLVRIQGHGLSTTIRQLAFVSPAYPAEVHDRIIRVAKGDFGGAKELCLLNFYLSELFVDACLELCEKAGVDVSDIDLIGTHGQTVYHIPEAEMYLGKPIRATMQIGDPSLLCEKIGAVTVSDFRVRDMAAGGLGAPLVPYTEYILYGDPHRNVGLQNIGGIGNITILPRNGTPEETYAFDTGPGNMVMDQLVERVTGGKQRYDADGRLAAQGKVSDALLAYLLLDPYLKKPLPKTTGREAYGTAYVNALLDKAAALGVSDLDALATATRFTAECIRIAVADFCPDQPDYLVIGGGGSRNPTLMAHLKALLPMPVLVNEDLGFDSEAKEAIAFAILANEAIHGSCNNVPSVTGAAHPGVMGKISI